MAPSLYDQLSFQNSEIRLLKFVAPWTGMTLACSLVTTPLPKAPKYVALSYNWGQQTNQVTICLEHFAVQVTANLYEALLRLRADGVLYIWADALCINQQNFDERSSQVARMGAIFQKASKVAVWLGSEPQTGENMRLLQHGTSYLFLDHYPEVACPAMFNELLSRPYWSRVWVIQEVTVAAEVLVYFGRSRISWDEFFRRCGLPLEHSKLSTALSDENTRGIATLLQFRRDKLSDRPINFLEALHRSRSSLFTDPRDKLFSVLGLNHNGRSFIPEPNYMSSTSEIFTEFATALITLGAPLDCVYLRSARERGSVEIPSWVPDWIDLDDVVARRKFDRIIKGPLRDSKSHETEWKKAVSISEAELTVRGILVDVVGSVGSIFTGGRGDIEPSAVINSQCKIRPNLGLETASLLYDTITGVGLLTERGCDENDGPYMSFDASWMEVQEAEQDRLSVDGVGYTTEQLGTIRTWLAANSSFSIAGRHLEFW